LSRIFSRYGIMAGGRTKHGLRQRDDPPATYFASPLRQVRHRRSGQHDDLLLALAVACWRAKVAVGTPLLSFYRNELELAKHRGEAVGSQSVESPSFRRTMQQVQDDAQELNEIYLNVLSGLQSTNVCASCGKPLGVIRINDGVNLWHSDCPVPRAYGGWFTP
jgi:hypothetical protein